jgi:hypothetical protein
VTKFARYFSNFGQRPFTRNMAMGLLVVACLVSCAFVLHHRYGSGGSSMPRQVLAPVDMLQPLNMGAVLHGLDVNLEKYRVLGEYLGRRYRVSTEVTIDIVAKAYAAGRKFELDPVLILAVICVESRFNPFAESDRGAKGLMQVVPRFHPDKFSSLGGEKVAFEPEANITVGASILKEYLRHTGDLGNALERYAGSAAQESDNRYSAKVTRERDRLNWILQKYLRRPASL